MSQKPGWALHCIESGVPAERSEESRLIFYLLLFDSGAAWYFACGMHWADYLVSVAGSAAAQTVKMVEFGYIRTGGERIGSRQQCNKHSPMS